MEMKKERKQRETLEEGNNRFAAHQQVQSFTISIQGWDPIICMKNRFGSDRAQSCWELIKILD